MSSKALLRRFIKAALLTLLSQQTMAMPTIVNPRTEREVTVRDGVEPCESSAATVGDGTPIQHILHKQLTESQHCSDSNSCSVAFTNENSLTFEWSAVLGPTDAIFISAGFSVSESFSDSRQYTCDGSKGDVVCVWYGMAHTGYTVRNEYYGSCIPVRSTDPYVIYAPNDNNVNGPGYYCVEGDACRTVDSEYWQYGVKTGPP
ncbi:hypothetical protein F5B20DRAFT_337342 [Whalleya microplaca]|nr:hypothetical protein F5B20DRAFT_337342 [Whalleya microplaca]